MYTKKIIPHKKFLFTIISLISILGYGFLVFAAPPGTGGYNPGETLNPDCTPGQTVPNPCIVKSIGGLSIGDTIGNSPDLNGVLYTNASGNVVTDDLFTRDAVTKDTLIGKDFDIPIIQYDLTTGNIIGLGSLSAPFNDGDQIEGVTSGATATIEHSESGLFYISNLSGTFQNGEPINNITSSETATVNQLYPTAPFAPGDTFIVYDPITSQTVGTGIVTAVTVNGFTVSPTSGIFDVYYLILDELGGGMSNIFGILDGNPVSSSSATTHGEIKIGSFLGGLVEGVGLNYRSDDGNKYVLTFAGTSIGGGDSYSARTLVGNISANNYASITQTLSNPNGTPEIQIGTVNAMAGHNSNLLLSGNRMILQNNQEIALLAGRIQIGSFDYNNDTEFDPYPAFPDYYYLPNVRGSAGQVLTDDGNGNVTWQTPSGATPLIGSTSTLGSETWLGSSAGGNGSSYNNTVFVGMFAGYGATNAEYSNFIGSEAGSGAISAYQSNFFGQYSGIGATSASYSNFLGYNSGTGATGAFNSNFLGPNAGANALSASDSNFFGSQAGAGAEHASYSNFVGNSAGSGALDAHHSNFIGTEAGNGATNANNVNFIGANAGYGAAFTQYSNFIGDAAGSGAISASQSNFIGGAAGIGAFNAAMSNFIGFESGSGAEQASNSNFIGFSTGALATNASNSNFFGKSAGYSAVNSSHSFFAGENSGAYNIGLGQGSQNAANAIFIGSNAGYFSADLGLDTTGSADDFAILLGQNTSTGGFENSIAIGSSATNTASNQFMIGSKARPISEMRLIIDSSNNQCVIDVDGLKCPNTPDGFLPLTGTLPSTSVTGPILVTGKDSINVNQNGSLASNTWAIYDISSGSSEITGGFSLQDDSDIQPVLWRNIYGIGATALSVQDDNIHINFPRAGAQCDIDPSGFSCSSDERLKKNIIDLSSNILDTVTQVRTVNFKWLKGTDEVNHIGFIAQDMQQYFPELVSTGSNGNLQVNYAGMTPILVEAIREMNLKITTINDMDTPNTWRDGLTLWFANVNNGITKLFADEIETKTLCVSDNTGDKTCITKAQLDQLLNGSVNGSIAPAPSPSPDPAPIPDTDPGTGDTPSDNSNPGPSDTGENPTDTPPADSAPAPTE